jgi:hypothetical protein
VADRGATRSSIPRVRGRVLKRGKSGRPATEKTPSIFANT